MLCAQGLDVLSSFAMLTPSPVLEYSKSYKSPRDDTRFNVPSHNVCNASSSVRLLVALRQPNNRLAPTASGDVSFLCLQLLHQKNPQKFKIATWQGFYLLVCEIGRTSNSLLQLVTEQGSTNHRADDWFLCLKKHLPGCTGSAGSLWI